MSTTAEFLKSKVSLFRDFTPSRLEELVAASRVRTFEANEAVAYQGSEVTQLAAVLRGKVRAEVRGAGGTRHHILDIDAGETFGEMALMTGEPLVADIVAATESELLLIPLSVFRLMVLSEPDAIQNLSRKIAERMKTVLSDPAKARLLDEPADPYGLALRGERPERILVLNCGSSSVKYSFYDTENPERVASGIVERIKLPGTRLRHKGPSGESSLELADGTFASAFNAVVAALTAKDTGVLRNAGEVSVVAHRVVHGGEHFTEAAIITPDVLKKIEDLNPLAPLHNPVNVAGIREMTRLFPAVPHVAVFDTAFHHTLPAYAYLYGIPYELYERHRIRRYGFHGTSHQYVSLRAAEFLKRKPNELRIVSCHLGNGSSLCAVDHGRSVDTTMGFTPTEGLIMGTRCGDLDPGVITFLERTNGMSVADCENLLNKQSGLLGLSGISSDMREILAAAENGQRRALLAVKTYCYRVRKYIGAYAAAMGGIDALVFTGGIGQGSAVVRALALQGLADAGIRLDDARNRDANGFNELSVISSTESKVSVLLVPTDEERMMAREALHALSRDYLEGTRKARANEPFLIEVSAHHVHLSQEHVELLFGKGHKLTPRSELSQPGQFACEEQVTLTGPKGSIERVRVLGPARPATQVEIAMTEQFKLGIHAPIRESGDVAGTPGCTLEGSAGKVTLQEGVICARRHIHMTPEDALRYGVRDKSVVRVRIAGERELVFGDVLVRVHPSFALAMHIDTDEANAADIRTGAKGTIEEIQS